MSTSGLLFTQNPDGTAEIGYEDYGVEFFDGGDIEVRYHLDKKNFKYFKQFIEEEQNEPISKALVSVFGKNFDSMKFEEYCKRHDLEFSKNVHIG